MLTAEDPATFISVPGLIIVLGGTVAATLISYPMNLIFEALKAVWGTLTHSRPHNLKTRIKQYMELMSNLKKGALKKVE